MKKSFYIFFRRLFFLIIFLSSFDLFAEMNKINHDKDVWYQLICIPLEDDRDAYTFEWIWRNTSWKDVIGFVEPKQMVQGSFKMSAFLFMNPSTRMCIELKGALSVFENNQLSDGASYEAGGITYNVRNGGVVWQPDKSFLLMLIKLNVYPESINDSGYEWW